VSRAPTKSTKGAGHPKANAPRTLAEFMAQALAMEREAAQRYSDLADAMDALLNEQRAERFFARLARAATVESVSAAAHELQAEEREHVKLVRAWMKKLPKPDRYWANDPDPATYTD
jgi:rubrerythrin